MFILAKSTIDPSNGDLFMQVFPQKFRSHKKAHAAMRKEYLKELEERGLEDNNAVDENGNDVMNTLGAGQVLLYTCNGCWQNVHVAIYSVM